MAIDNTPPRLKLIATIAVITVITLVAIDFASKSYYGMMTHEAQREKIAPLRDRDEQQKAEQAALTGAVMPIDQAMAQIVKGARPDTITPQPSDDMGPMTGWSKLPKPAPTPHPVSALAPATETAADGGALMAGDAGVPLVAGDAGVAHGKDGGVAAGKDGGAPAAGNKDAGAHRNH